MSTNIILENTWALEDHYVKLFKVFVFCFVCYANKYFFDE